MAGLNFLSELEEWCFARGRSHPRLHLYICSSFLQLPRTELVSSILCLVWLYFWFAVFGECCFSSSCSRKSLLISHTFCSFPLLPALDYYFSLPLLQFAYKSDYFTLPGCYFTLKHSFSDLTLCIVCILFCAFPKVIVLFVFVILLFFMITPPYIGMCDFLKHFSISL